MWRKNVVGKVLMVCALMALLLLSACTVMITPEAGTGAATAAPQEEATAEATEEPIEEAGSGSSELVGPTWQWVETEMGDGTIIAPTDPTRYTLTFHDDGTVSAQLDCNSGSGTYEVDGPSLTFGPMASTMMACPEDSLASEFAVALGNVNSYVFQDGHLFLALKLDSGIMEFAPAEAAAEATSEATEEATEEATPEATEEPSEEASDGSGELVGPTWQWVQTQYGDDTVLVATDPTRYTLTFHDDGTVSAQLDCNSGSGTYTVDGSSLTFGPMASTLMACLGETQANEFAMDLAEVNSHVFQDGHLFLALKLDSGIMEFAPADATEATPEATEEPSEEASDMGGELVGPTWQWIETEMGDGTIIAATDPTRYTLTFHDDGTVSAQLDCNSGSGTYTVDGPSLTFGPMASTMMACPEDSQVDDFTFGLENVNSHVFQDGHLFLALQFDSGIMEFAPVGDGAAATPEATEEPSEEASGELVGPTWQWVQSIYEGDMIVASNDPTRYTITFLEDGTFQAQLDCNSGFGSYTVDGSNLTIGAIGSTRMACPSDSLDSTFAEDLSAVVSYAIADGNLHLTLSEDGVMELSPAP